MTPLRSAPIALMVTLWLAACYQGDLTHFDKPTQVIPNNDNFEGVEELLSPLSEIVCTITDDTMSFSLQANEIGVLSRNIDNNILLNGYTCPSSGPGPFATIYSTYYINIDRQAGVGAVTVILDYSGGLFAPNRYGLPGVVLSNNFSPGDQLKIVGSNYHDRYWFGSAGISITANRTDIDPGSIDTFLVNTGPSNDVVSAVGWYRPSGSEFPYPITIYGGEGNDTLIGGSAGDTIYGGEGDDKITGGMGSDTLYGEAGDDIFFEQSTANGADIFDGGSGLDTVSYSDRSNPISVTLGDLQNDGETGELDDVQQSIETVVGTKYDDAFTCHQNVACTLYGGEGNDTLVGSSESDILRGGVGDDTLSGLAGADTLSGGFGNDTVDYSNRTADLQVTMDDDLANDGEASEGDNVLNDIENILCGSGNDTITGNRLDNQITGGQGDDELYGEAGDDTFFEGTGPNGADLFRGGTGTDLVEYANRTAALVVTMDGIDANDGESLEGDNVGADVENINGGDQGDIIVGNDLANTIFGAGGDDTLNGGSGDDTIDGGSANNTIDCGAGDGDIGFNGSTSNCEL